jgi:hypothetical protein
MSCGDAAGMTMGLTILMLALAHWWVSSSIGRALRRIADFRTGISRHYMEAGQAATRGRIDRLGMMVEYMIFKMDGKCRYMHGISFILIAGCCAACIFMPEPRDFTSAFLTAYLLGAVAPACLLYRLVGLAGPLALALQLSYAFGLSMRSFVVIMKGRELGLYGDREQELLDAELDDACGKCCEMANAAGISEEMNAAMKVSRPGYK